MTKHSHLNSEECVICSGQQTRKEFYQGIARNIAKFGTHLVGVLPEGSKMAFTYSIGNHERGLPELLVIGAHPSVLNALSAIMHKRKRGFDDGELVSLGGKYPVKVIEAGSKARTNFAIQAGRYYDTEDYRVQQVLVPDQDGRFPGDPDCLPPYSRVPVLRASAARG